MRPSLKQVLFRSAAGLDLNFAGGVFSLTNTRTDSPAAIPGWSFSRTDTNGTATALDLAGNVIQFPSRTNLVLRSQQIGDGVSWVLAANGAAALPVVTLNGGVAPDGSLTASRLQLNTVGSTVSDRSRVVQGLTVVNSTVYTSSIWLKAFDAGNVGKTVRVANDGIGIDQTVTLTADWVRVTATGTSSLTSPNFIIETRGTITTTTADVLVWGAQLETGSTATAYIPTTTAAVTVVLPRITNRGILVEEARTNGIRNSVAAGAVAGTPGTLPTNWLELSLGAGISRQVVGAGTEDGLTYVDMRFFGTTSTSPAVQLNFEQPGIVAASAAQVWTTSCFTKLVAGSLADVSLVTLRLYPRSAVPAELTGVVSSDLKSEITAARTRISAALTTPASTATVNTGLAFSVTGTKTLDFTIRLYSPQLELGAFATSPIITTGAAGTRGADAGLLTFANALGTPLTIVADFTGTTVSGGLGAIGIVSLDDGSTANRVQVRAVYTSGGAQQTVVAANSVLENGSSANSRTLSGSRQALRITSDGRVTTAANNAIEVAETAALSIPTTNRLSLGSIPGSVALNGYIRRVQVLPFAATDAQLQALTAP